MPARSIDIRFVLVRPRNSGNVGSVVRVLRNFGLPPPRVVDMYQFDPAEARRLAAGCEADVDAIEFHATLAEALADRSFVVGTTAHRRARWRMVPLRQALAERQPHELRKAAILFGNEKSGLSEAELSYCEHLLTIPTVKYGSLNLAQAVAITAWETAQITHPPRHEKAPDLAPRQVIEPMFDQMFEALEAISFVHPDQDEHVRILLRQLFSRNGLTKKDVQVLRGIWHQVNWLAGELRKKR